MLYLTAALDVVPIMVWFSFVRYGFFYWIVLIFEVRSHSIVNALSKNTGFDISFPFAACKTVHCCVFCICQVYTRP
jgi:hypothetical protein